jgi:hypothetical protein
MKPYFEAMIAQQMLIMLMEIPFVYDDMLTLRFYGELKADFSENALGSTEL